MVSASLKTTGVTFDDGISDVNKKLIQKVVDSFK